MKKNDFSRLLTASEEMKVPFHDIDPAEVVWHGRYFKYFEVVRCTLLEELQYSYAEMIASGYVWPVVDTSVRYVRPLVLDQKFTVIAGLREWEMRMVVDYKILSEDGTLHTRGRTVQVPIEMKTRELRLGSPDVFIRKVQERFQSVS
jgi:acyl-CoA thioester hydrolase